MNEEEPEEMIAGTLTEMVTDNQVASTVTVTAEEKPVTTHVTETTEIEEGLIPDVTEVDLCKQLSLKNVVDPEAPLKMKTFSSARLGIGRAGARYMTSSTLRFRTDHVAVQDAVFSGVSEDLVKEINFISTKTIRNSKDEHLTRPDYGRQFDEENSEITRKNTTPKTKIQMVVGDGLSSAAIEANIKEVLSVIKQGLDMYSLDFDNVVFAKYCRVSVTDKIGEITGADVVCLLVGERPGLVTAESISVYTAYKPTVGVPEVRQIAISSTHKGETPAVEAGVCIAEIVKKMSDKKKSDIDLKEAEQRRTFYEK